MSRTTGSRISNITRICLGIITLFCLCSSMLAVGSVPTRSGSAEADESDAYEQQGGAEVSSCEAFITQIDELKQEMAVIQEHRALFNTLLTDVAPGGQGADVLRSSGDLFNVQLNDPVSVAAEIDRLQQRKEMLAEDLKFPGLPRACAALEKTRKRIAKETQQAEIELIDKLLAVLQLPQNLRAYLQIQLNLLERLADVQAQIAALRASSYQAGLLQDKPESPHSLNLQQLAQLKVLTEATRQKVKQWWRLTMGPQLDLKQANQFWFSVITRDERALEGILTQSAVFEEAALEKVAAGLYGVINDMALDLTQWRNHSLFQAGWSAFFMQWLEPEIFFQSIVYELRMLPAVVWHRLTQPFFEAYQEAVAEDFRATLLSSWILQLLGLLILLSILIRSAAQAASWLASVQQQWLDKLESATGHSILSGFFWMLKPNASWVFILLVAQASTLVVPENWKILNLLAPLATLYAAFRALRIILEWCFSRAYTRSGIFLSNNTSEKLVLDSLRMTWGVLYLGLAWVIVYIAGGGYLLYLVSFLAVILFFVALWLLMFKHAAAVNKLIFQVLGIRLDDANAERGWWLRVLGKLGWPLIFLLAQFLDVLSSLNQKLMVFDVYRSFSVKLLRVRLDSRTEEVEDEDEGAEPDQNYNDWMLREAPENLLFDVGDVSGLLTPLKHWFSEKTDENLMVVIGESGSGKSTLVRRLPKLWTESPVKVLDVSSKTFEPQVIFDQIADTLGIERFTDIAGLVRQDANLSPQVLVIDSAHNLFLAEVGYLKAYKALLECMNAHLVNVFWLVVMHSPSWNYLNCVFSREQRISNVYKMPRWSPLDIRKLILSRHQGGRRRLKYNEMLLSAAASSESSSVRAADSRVFNILWEQCGGNPLAAIELWLNAVKVKGRVAEVGVPQRPPSNLLNGLKDDLFFVYTAIVAHSELSTSEIMRVTHFSEPVVRHALKQGINLGMIIRDSSKRYRVDPYWYGTLSGFLHRKNMLWD